MPLSSVSTDTPSHVVSSLDHLVTQWMSRVTVSLGNARSSSHVQCFSSSTSPSTENDHCASAVGGVGPAESTGKSRTRYCPGGKRASRDSSRGRPLNARLTTPTSLLLHQPAWKGTHHS